MRRTPSVVKMEGVRFQIVISSGMTVSETIKSSASICVVSPSNGVFIKNAFALMPSFITGESEPIRKAMHESFGIGGKSRTLKGRKSAEMFFGASYSTAAKTFLSGKAERSF